MSKSIEKRMIQLAQAQRQRDRTLITDTIHQFLATLASDELDTFAGSSEASRQRLGAFLTTLPLTTLKTINRFYAQK